MKILVQISKRLLSRDRAFTLKVSFFSHRDFVVLFGPSGSGKTLTLQVIAGLWRPDAGRILIQGRCFFDAVQGLHIPARQRRLGYVPQDYALFPHLSVADNVGFGLLRGIWGRLGRQDRRRVEEMLEVFELTPAACALPEQLSGGQRQRVALARALICQPQLLLLDEPFAALDGFLRRHLRQTLLTIQAHFGIPVILITHDPEDVAALAQTLVVFDTGRVSHILDLKDWEQEHPSPLLFPAFIQAAG